MRRKAFPLFVIIAAISVYGCGDTGQQVAHEPGVPEAVPAVEQAPAEMAAPEPAADPDRIIETWGYRALEPATGVARGKQVYEQWCIICHGPGPGMAGTDGLQRKYHGSLPAILTERTDLSAEAVRVYVRNGVASMPYFRKTEISDEDLDAMLAYLVGAEGGQPAQ